MSISNQQYESIMRIYKSRQINNENELLAKTLEINELIPEYKALDDMLADTALAQTKALINGNSKGIEDIKNQIDGISQKKQELLLSKGYPKDYLTLHYGCPDCQDTGYIGNEKCHCLQKMLTELLYDKSNLSIILKDSGFEKLSYDYYEGDDLSRFEKAVADCKTFSENFKDSYQNFIFYGTVGTGKSFLSGCIAKELLNKNVNVLYFSSTELFRILSDIMFDRLDREVLRTLRNDLYYSELLIIDDLGTELTNNAVVSQLFSLLNERHLHSRSTIISTNLEITQLQDRYADRIFSRLLEWYSFYKITGPDIRRIRKMNIHNT